MSIFKMVRLIVALDGMSLEAAISMAANLFEAIPGIGLKVGDLLDECGTKIIRTLKYELGAYLVMADPKIGDIPNTVANRCRRYAEAGADIITIHPYGGPEMMIRALEAVEGQSSIALVTNLTSLAEQACRRYFGRSVAENVRFFAAEASYQGVPMIVCPAPYTALIRQASDCDPGLQIINPGIRLPEGEVGDQVHVGTPVGAVRAGANFLVVGRPIIEAANPVEAARQFLEQIRQAEEELAKAG